MWGQGRVGKVKLKCAITRVQWVVSCDQAKLWTVGAFVDNATTAEMIWELVLPHILQVFEAFGKVSTIAQLMHEVHTQVGGCAQIEVIILVSIDVHGLNLQWSILQSGGGSFRRTSLGWF